jgi:AraC-like DNA-binding protein
VALIAMRKLCAARRATIAPAGGAKLRAGAIMAASTIPETSALHVVHPKHFTPGWTHSSNDSATSIPYPAATRAAHLIREHHSKAWDVTALSQRVHATAAQLTRDFRREYGMSIRTYQRRISLVMALPRVREEKVEAIALELGYRSRKNFYLAFKRATGLTPTAFRELPLHQAQRIIDNARMTANAARPAPRMSAEWSSHGTRPPRAVAADASRS